MCTACDAPYKVYVAAVSDTEQGPWQEANGTTELNCTEVVTDISVATLEAGEVLIQPYYLGIICSPLSEWRWYKEEW